MFQPHLSSLATEGVFRCLGTPSSQLPSICTCWDHFIIFCFQCVSNEKVFDYIIPCKRFYCINSNQITKSVSIFMSDHNIKDPGYHVMKRISNNEENREHVENQDIMFSTNQSWLLNPEDSSIYSVIFC